MEYKGISFPFRLSDKGGVVTTVANMNSVPHIVESIQQILTTRRLERCMEYHIYSDIDTLIFENNDESTRSLLKYEIEQALTLEKRIEVQDIDVYSEDNKLMANIHFTVPEFDNKDYYTEVEVGSI